MQKIRSSKGLHSPQNIFIFEMRLFKIQKFSVVQYGANWRTFKSNLEKSEKKSTTKTFLSFLAPRLKNSLYFRKWDFLALRLKKFLYFLKKVFSYISGNGTFLKNFLYFRKKLPSSRNKKKKGSENFFYIFSKKVCLIFWETKLSYILLKRVLCLSEKESFISKKLNKIFLYS